MGWLSARTAAGDDYGNRYAFAFRFRDGRICEGWELLDSAHFLAQMPQGPMPEFGERPPSG